LPSDVNTVDPSCYGSSVSILVFVELALGPPSQPGDPMAYQVVSILVFVELALGLRSLNYVISLLNEFQSLFSWNLPSDVMLIPPFTKMGPGVSILVFVELALGPSGRA